MRISTREESVGWDFRKDFWAARAVEGRSEISEVLAEGRVRMGLLVLGEIVVIVEGEEGDVDVDVVVSPLAGIVEVLSCVMFAVWYLVVFENLRDDCRCFQRARTNLGIFRGRQSTIYVAEQILDGCISKRLESDVNNH